MSPMSSTTSFGYPISIIKARSLLGRLGFSLYFPPIRWVRFVGCEECF